ncbi:AI-2E family transporter [Ramlibacter rhizophilus]|uniref:AI-2E family transporter n=2 Tax=Ramlibacter rhizophilus TaxID=1781167 RepID=A0A4Z0BK83_9BURK|nr:AI-2E family transporter [Ramlibacter rhizophilus]
MAPLRVAAAAVTGVIVVAGLYFGRELLVPLTVAFLLSFVLEPAVVRLKRRRLPRAAAVAVVVTLMLAALAAATLVLSEQVRALSAELPRYEATIRGKIRDLNRTLTQPGALEGAARTLETVRQEVKEAQPKSPLPTVQVETAPPSPLDAAMAWLEAVGGPLASAGISFVFLVLILLDRQALRDRMLRLLGGDLHRTTDAMDEASGRISKYLLMQLVVNATYGIPMGLGLWLIGVPGAMLWGVVAALMRFIPFIGPFIAAAFPLTLAFAVDPGWSMLVWTALLITVLELVSNNVVEPLLYGPSTGLSAMSLIVSATFWVLLWGPVGLVISTPLTVCILVFSRHIPGLQFMEVLLGSQPVLDAPTRFYQRLIADDLEEVVDMAEEHVAADGLVAFYDDIAIPALRLASLHRQHAADAEHRLRVLEGMERVMVELEQRPAPQSPAAGPPQVVAMGGKWEIDLLAARMVVQALQEAGVPARVLDGDFTSSSFFQRLDLHGARILCLSVFAAEPQAQVRFLCRRLRRRWPDLKIVLAAWSAPAENLASVRDSGVNAVASGVKEVLAATAQLAGPSAAAGHEPAPLPEDEPQRLAALRGSGILGESHRPAFDRMARRAADIFDVPIALVTVVDEELQHVVGSSDAASGTGRDAPAGDAGAPPARGGALANAFRWARSDSVCSHVVHEKSTVVVEDVARDPRFAGNAALQAQGVRFYAGAPLADPQGQVFGALCLMDTQPRELSERERRLLQTMAQDLMEPLFAAPVASPETPADEPPAASSASTTVGQPVPE